MCYVPLVTTLMTRKDSDFPRRRNRRLGEPLSVHPLTAALACQDRRQLIEEDRPVADPFSESLAA